MKILVIGNLWGDIDLINKYIKESDIDLVLSTGNFGIFKEGHKPKGFIYNTFSDYFSGEKEFLKPVYAIRGSHDNLFLCNKLYNNELLVYNFTLLKNGEKYIYKEVSFGGIGGSYSPKKYFLNDKKLNKNFNQQEIRELEKKQINILLMHDLIGQCSKKKIIFSDDTYSLFDKTAPFYCLIGKYGWWGKSNLINKNVVVLPDAKKGYLVIDTSDEWNSKGIISDLNSKKEI